MSENKNQVQEPVEEILEEEVQEAAEPAQSEVEVLKAQLAQQEDKYLRLAAEYENYRRRLPPCV